MDTNQMVNIKPEPRIKEGKNLLKKLEELGLKPNAFFWFYLSNANSWRLIISATLFNNKESVKNYSDFISKFGKYKEVNIIGIENITLVPSNDDLINLIKVAIRTPASSISGIRFTSNVINGILIDDAYIYRIS